jgi:HEAT repeat protein
LCDGGLPEEATGRVWLLGCDGVPRWQLRKLSYPVDARLMAGGRVLVAERSLEARVRIPLALPPRKRSAEEGVSMRDLDGKVLWRYRDVSDPTQCQLTPDGHILITGRELELAEVDKTGQELFRKDFSVTAFPNGLTSHHNPGTYIEPHALLADTRLLLRQLNDKSHSVEWLEVYAKSSSAFGVMTEAPEWASYYLLRPGGLERMADIGDGLEIEQQHLSWVERPVRVHNGLWLPSVWARWIPGVFRAANLPNGEFLVGGIGRAVELAPDGRPVWSSSFEDQAQRVRPCLNRLRLGFDAPRTELDLTANPADWLQGLQSKSATVRRRTADAIRQFALVAVEAAASSLKPLLMDSDEAVRDAARRTLGRLSSDVPPEWTSALKDKNPRGWEEVRKLLIEPYSPSKKFETLLCLLKDKDAHVRLEALVNLRSANPFTEKVVSADIAALRDDDAHIRHQAALFLGVRGRPASSAIPALLTGLKDSNARVRGRCAWSLGFIDPADKRVVPALIEAVQAKEMNWHALEALGYCGSHAKEAVPMLLKMLKAKDLKGTQEAKDNLRASIVHVLGSIGPDAKAAVPALVAILRDRSPQNGLRPVAASALGEIGPAAKVAVPDLEEMKRKGDLGPAAAEILEKIQEY